MKHMPYTRFISAALAALVMISLLPFASCGTKATQTEKSAPADNVSQAATTPQDIQNQLAQTEAPAPPSASEQAISNLADTGAKAAELAADPLKAASDTEALKASVEDSVSQVEDNLSATRDKLAELGLSGKQEQFEAASAQITSELSSVRQASANLKEGDPASYSALSEKIDGLLTSPEPATLSSNLSHLTDSSKPTPPTYGTSIAPAYLAGTPGITPSTLPLETGDGDLADTPDAPQSEEIVALATQLNHDPVAIYEWVRNNIDFESYYGSRKGAAGTLKEQAGNSTDTASLLIALMRASGIPARYVTGVIELTYDQATAWLATDTIEDAQSLLASGGIPVTGIIEGGTLSKLQLTQTYVEAYVNYENYRGASAGEGPSTWIPLDASYKTYDVSYPQADILSVMGATYETLSQEYLSSVSEDTFLSFIEAKAKTWLAANMPQLTLQDVMRTKSIKQENLGLLPSDLLCKLVSAESEERELAASARWKATLTLAGTSLTCDFVSLASGTIEVSFTPATSDDEALLAAYENISDIPAYLLDMTGEITAGDNTAQTQAAPFGSSSSWSLAITSPTRSYQINNTLNWGAPFSVALERQPLPVNQSLTLQMGPSYPHCLFNQAASSYITNCATDDGELASIFGLNLTRGTQEASVGISLTPKYVSGVAVSVSPDSTYIDADLSTATPAGLTKDTRRDFTRASGLSGSAHEHLILKDCFQTDAISTARAISLANACEVPVITLNRGNWASLSPSLELPAYIKAQMRDQVNAGYTVTTPTQPIIYMDFTGEGWMVTDPATGEGAYLISGGLSGGKVVEQNKLDGVMLLADWSDSYLSSCEILSPGNGSNFLKGETIVMDMKYRLKPKDPSKPEFDVFTKWNIKTEKDCYIPGPYILKAEITLFGQVLYGDYISVNIFGLLKMKNDGMWVPPGSVQNVQVQAVDFNGIEIGGFYSSGNDDLPVQTLWEWDEDSYAKNARFLESEERFLSSSLDDKGHDVVDIRMGDQTGKYRIMLSTPCQYFMSWEDRDAFLKKRILTIQPIANEIYAFQGFKQINNVEVKIIDNRHTVDEAGNFAQDQFIDAFDNHRIDWGKIVGIQNSGEESMPSLDKFRIGVRIEFEEDGGQTLPNLIPDDFEIPVTVSSHIIGEYYDLASIEPREVLVRKVPSLEIDQGSIRQVYFTSGDINPLSQDDGDGIFIPQDRYDGVNEYTTINAFMGGDYYFQWHYPDYPRGCNNSDMRFSKIMSDNGWKKRGFVSVLYTTGPTSEELTADSLKEQEILTFGDELQPAEPIGYKDYHTVNLLRAGGGVEVIEAKLEMAECQTNIAQPQTDKALVKNPTDWLYIQAHSDITGALGNSKTNSSTTINPPMFAISAENRIVMKKEIDIQTEVFINSLSEVENLFLFACNSIGIGPGFRINDGGVCWMTTGAHHIMGYWDEVPIDSADNVISKFFSEDNPIPYENIELRWVRANSGNNTYLSCALTNLMKVNTLKDRIENQYTYENYTEVLEDLKLNLLQGYYYNCADDSLVYKELSPILQLPYEPVKPQDWDIYWIRYP